MEIARKYLRWSVLPDAQEIAPESGGTMDRGHLTQVDSPPGHGAVVLGWRGLALPE